MIRLFQGDCFEVGWGLISVERKVDGLWHPYDAVFVDPPDNLDLDYEGVRDDKPPLEYQRWLSRLITLCTQVAPTTWISFNERHTFAMSQILAAREYEVKRCVQVFTFGQHNKYDFGNCYRPLWRITNAEHEKSHRDMDAVRVESWRQANGDKRADPRGRVPSDVFDFPRVTGNSKQRRTWHKTQLHEGLVERCLLSSVPPDGKVLDPCAGTGTVGRVCNQLGFHCDMIELSKSYCDLIAKEYGNSKDFERMK
jgi:DNA modification methylase